jgi:hypothetical protein
MDKKEIQDWSWLPKAMPKVSSMVREQRDMYGDAHVNECWRRGVINGEAGWFFAREGPLAVGTPCKLCEELDAMGNAQGFEREPLLMLRKPADE